MSAFAILGLHQVTSYRCHNRATVGGGTYPTEPSLPSISRHQNRLLGDIADVRPHCVSKRSVQPSPPHTQIMASSMLRSMLAATQKHIHLHQRQLRTTSRVAYDAQLLHLEFFWSFAQQVSSRASDHTPHHFVGTHVQLTACDMRKPVFPILSRGARDLGFVEFCGRKST